jgi:superfamily I DNA/RNA helicase
MGEAWAATYSAALQVLQRRVPNSVVKSSYASVFVDEYQDCTAGQHAIVLALADLMPCRVLGDPLQGIFGFRNNRLVCWQTEVFPNFHRLPDLIVPWRWLGRNPTLGAWLLGIRPALEAGEPIDLAASPVEWRRQEPTAQARACLDVARRPGSVAALLKWPTDCHRLARKLKGRFTSMEEMDCKDLLEVARRLQGVSGPEMVRAVLDTAEACMTRASTVLQPVSRALEAGRPIASVRQQNWRPAVHALARLEETADLADVAGALRAMSGESGVVVFRRELFLELLRAIGAYARGGHATLEEAAWWIRNLTRATGRRMETRTVSRTLLVKGLEFDHVIVANGDELDAKNLYVALSRASSSATVLSRSQRVTPAPR